MTKKENSFDKITIVKSKRFSDFKDVLMVILDDKKTYTILEVQKLINKFLSKEV